MSTSNRKNKINIAILMGGPSNESRVSLATGRVIKSMLDRTKYLVRTVVMDRAGNWRKKITKNNTDLVFNALHGKVGEDGQLQGYLDVLGVPYTGSGVLASALGMDKFVSRQLFVSSGLDVPAGVLLMSEPENLNNFDLPAVVKPNSSGSSLGVHLVKTREEIIRAIRATIAEYGSALVEPLIKGRELTVSVLGNEQPEPLPVVEIIPRGSSFFDYKNKYQKNGALEKTPADLSETARQLCQAAAVKAHQSLGCRGYSRTDMFLTKEGNIKVLETNTLPGMTQASLLPKSAAAAGITFMELLDRIVGYARA